MKFPYLESLMILFIVIYSLLVALITENGWTWYMTAGAGIGIEFTIIVFYFLLRDLIKKRN